MWPSVRKYNKFIAQKECGNKGNRQSILCKKLREGTDNPVVLTHGEKR